MNLKYLISLALLSLPLLSQAAFTTCNYEVQPCDQFGNHYHCVVLGWTGANPPEYCAPSDKSTGPAKSDPDADKAMSDADKSCLPDCGRRCLEAPIFCGQW